MEKLWPQAVTERDFERFKYEQKVLENVLYIGKCMGLEMDEEDIKELITAQSEELTAER